MHQPPTRASMQRTVHIDFARVFDAMPDPCLLLDRRLAVIGANRAYLDATMTVTAAIVGRPVADVLPDEPGEAAGPRSLRASLERVLAKRAPDRMGLRRQGVRWRGGSFEERWWSPVNTPVLDEAGEVSAIVHHIRDVTEQRRARREHEGQRRVLELVAAGAPVEEVLEAVCRLTEEEIPDSVCCVLRFDPGTGCLRAVAMPSLPALGPVIDGTPVAEGAGTCGTACARGQAVVVADMAVDPLTAAGHAPALRRLGLAACWSKPILAPATGELLGCFSVFHRSAGRVPTQDEITRRDELLRWAAIAVERQRAAELEQAGEAALRASEERFRQFAENSADVLWIVDARTQRLEYLSPAFERVWGESREAALHDLGRWAETVHSEDREHAAGGLPRLLRGETLVQEYRIVRPDGAVRWICDTGFPVRDQDGSLRRLAGIAQDVTERKLVEERVRELALRDPLTGLPNRALLLDRLALALAAAQRGTGKVAVLLLDLDGFKDVNDTLGHPAGDRLLRQVGSRLTTVVRAGDTLARLGGDEFAIVQPDLRRLADGEALAAKLLAALAGPFDLDGEEVHVGASIGVALFPRDGDDVETLLRRADLALYRVKAEGRAGFRCFAPAMDTAARARHELTHELRRALELGELEVYYQPQLDLATGRFAGVEALVRWRHPQRGLVLPGEFIPLAEATGLIRPLDEWVLREACRQAAAWRASGLPVTVAVNLSPAELRQGAPPRVGQALRRAGLAPAGLELEITEGVLMESLSDGGDGFLRRLAARGVRLAIDDFGVGYSSLAYLRRLPVQKIKIDRSFVAAVGVDPDGEQLLRSIVALGHSLGKRVVAEGVESEAQLVFLRAAGCDEAQGFHLAPPMPGAEVERLLLAGGLQSAGPPDRAPAREPRKEELAELLHDLDGLRAKLAETRRQSRHWREQSRLAQDQAQATRAAAQRLIRQVRGEVP